MILTVLHPVAPSTPMPGQGSPQTMERWHSAAVLLAQRHYTNVSGFVAGEGDKQVSAPPPPPPANGLWPPPPPRSVGRDTGGGEGGGSAE